MTLRSKTEMERIRTRVDQLRPCCKTAIEPYTRYLNRVRNQYREVQILNDRCARYREMLTGAGSGTELSARGQGDVRSREKNMLALIDARDQLSERVDRMMEETADAERMIRMLNDANQRATLETRYLLSRSWDEASDELHFSKRWLQKLHREGLLTLCAMHELGLYRLPDGFWEEQS